MNVTADPKQNGLLFETIETDGTNVEVTVIVIAFEVAVVVLGQEAVDVITQVGVKAFKPLLDPLLRPLSDLGLRGLNELKFQFNKIPYANQIIEVAKNTRNKR